MKKYTPCDAKWYAAVAAACAVALIVGLVLLVAGNQNDSLIFCLIGLGGFFSLLFFGVFLAEKSRFLVIDDQKIIFPRGATQNGKLAWQRTTVNRADLISMERELHRGDPLIDSKDCFCYILTLKDGTKVSVHLYAYGKNGEKEIAETIRQNITQVS